MEITLQQVRKLLEAVSEKTGYPLEHGYFEAIADEIGPGVGKKYLYGNLFLCMKDGKGDELVGLQDNKLNVIARFLGYNSIHQFLQGRKTDPVLQALEGSYYCYVRRGSKDSVVFRSPVVIQNNGSNCIFELRGPKWIYTGSVTLSNGCLFILMRSGSGKEFHHVYKIGVREKPEVLQGIFSGVSTGFEPIGGRVVLVASDEPYEKLEGRELTVQELKNEGKPGAGLANYFGSFEENNLRIKAVVTFNEDDL